MQRLIYPKLFRLFDQHPLRYRTDEPDGNTMEEIRSQWKKAEFSWFRLQTRQYWMHSSCDPVSKASHGVRSRVWQADISIRCRYIHSYHPVTIYSRMRYITDLYIITYTRIVAVVWDRTILQ